MHCKHRLRILGGNREYIISGNEDEVSTVISWLPGSNIEDALQSISAAEKKFETAKKELARAKKKLDEALSG